MKKAISMLMALGMCSTLLAGCGGAASSAATSSTAASSTEASSVASSEAAAPEEEVTLKVSTWDATSNPSDTDAIAAFEAANPNIHIELMDIPSADYTTKLSVMLNGGSDLDAFWIKDADTTKTLADKGQLVDLTDRVASAGIDMAGYNGVDKNFNFDGKQYAMPIRTDYYVMFYNKDVFDAASVAYPTNDWTWTDFEETAKTLTSGTGAEKTYGAFIHTWQACVENWGVQDGKNTIMDYQTGYDFFKPYYDMAVRMQADGTIQDYGELKTGNIHYSSPFAKGTVGMMPMGTWFMATMAEKVKTGESTVNWGVATLPHPEGVEAGYTVGSTTPMAINAASTKQDAAWKFVEFMSGEGGAASYAADGYIPAMSTTETLKTLGAIDGMPEGLAEALVTKNISADRPITDKVSEVNQMLGEEHSLIMLGELSVDDGLAEMATRAGEILG